jgi:hypothetical protein
MNRLCGILDAWSRIRPRINLQDVQAIRMFHQVAELMTLGCSFHDAQANLLLTAKITHGATLCVPTLSVCNNNHITYSRIPKSAIKKRYLERKYKKMAELLGGNNERS